MKDWQIKLLENPIVDKEQFLQQFGDKLDKISEDDFKHLLKFHTKFSGSEVCEVMLDRIFEEIGYLDLPNADYLSHYVVVEDTDLYLFENKCGRADFLVYKVQEYYNLISFDESKGEYIITNKNDWNEVWKRMDCVFSIRLKDLKFIEEFFENFIGKKLTYRKDYQRGLKLKQILK